MPKYKALAICAAEEIFSFFCRMEKQTETKKKSKKRQIQYREEKGASER
jgi:hypothetical protein